MSRQDRDDPIIVLCVSDTTFVTYRTTLTSVEGSYFSARFGNTTNDMTPGGVYGQDQWGRTIYFIDRDPELFKYVLEFLRTGKIENMLPQPYHENRGFWRRLHDEAMFYALDDLATRCEPPVHSCPPNPQSRGVFYMLGTDYGRKGYSNPHMSNKVHVGGWCDEVSDTDDVDARECRSIASPDMVRSMFVQYRPLSTLKNHALQLAQHGFTHCDYRGASGWTAVVDLRGAAVNPTHYSLRHECCYGMRCPWQFEASTDGKAWETLHENQMDHRGLDQNTREEVLEKIEKYDLTESERSEYVTEYLEKYNRYTWQVQSGDTFYGFFRIRCLQDEDGHYDCWHGTGLEIFGNLREM